MEVDEDTNIYFSLSQPELLSKEAILEILSKKGVNIYGFDQKSKDDLVQEYYKSACPLPQRKYRNNRRGREMMKSQIRVSKRKRTFDQISDSDSGESNSFTIATSVGTVMNSNMPKSGFINQFDFLGGNGNRLKPPPIAIDPNKKVVKLGGSKTNNDTNKSTEGNKSKITFQGSPIKSEKIASNAPVKISTKSNLDSIVINSNFKKKSEEKQELLSEKNKIEQTVNNGTNIKPNSQYTETQSVNKIKLKRRNDIVVPSSEEILGSLNNSEDKTSQKADKKSTLVTDSINSPIRYSSNITGPKQRQINLINDVIKQRAKVDGEPPQPQEVKQKKEKEEEDGVVTKRFKSISISWP